jgi:hypothetical protein
MSIQQYKEWCNTVWLNEAWSSTTNTDPWTVQQGMQSAFLQNDWIQVSTTWKYTNPGCLKPLTIGERRKSSLPGTVVLNCHHCGFEFLVHAEQVPQTAKAALTKVDFDLAVLKRKVKDFELV